MCGRSGCCPWVTSSRARSASTTSRARPWNPEGFGPDCQPLFLREFARRNYGEKAALPLADFLMEFYRLGNIRKPELMNRAWALSLPDDEAAKLTNDYTALLKQEESLAALLPADARDAYTETVGFPMRVLGSTPCRVPDGSKDEKGKVRIAAVRDNHVQLQVPLPGLSGGKHVLKISAVDPRVVIDRFCHPWCLREPWWRVDAGRSSIFRRYPQSRR